MAIGAHPWDCDRLRAARRCENRDRVSRKTSFPRSAFLARRGLTELQHKMEYLWVARGTSVKPNFSNTFSSLRSRAKPQPSIHAVQHLLQT